MSEEEINIKALEFSMNYGKRFAVLPDIEKLSEFVGQFKKIIKGRE
jgi:hypothetical protein